MPRASRTRAGAVAVDIPGCCPFQGAIDLLSKRHALVIIWYLQQEGTSRFNGIRRAIGVNPVSLTQRLEELEKAGVVARRAFKETPPRVEYSLTRRGMELVPLMDRLGEWASGNLAEA